MTHTPQPPFMPEPRRARWVLRVAALGLALLLAWAGWAQIEQVTRASGQVIASARTQLVQTPDGGVLQKLLVKEGERVRKGQVLAVLERARVQAAVNDTSAKVAALQITLARLTAEVYGRPLVFAAPLQKYRDYVQNQTELYQQRQLILGALHPA